MNYQIIQFVNLIFEVLTWLVIIRCILSFVRHDPYHPVIRFIYDVTEPIMAPIRRIVPSSGGLDFSPIVVLLVITLVQRIVVSLLSTFL